MQKHLRTLSLLNLAFCGLGCSHSTPAPSTSMTPTPEAIASPSSHQQTSPTQIESMLSQFQNRCQGEETAFVFAETREYWLNICGIFSPEFFVTVNKQDKTLVRLPITDYDLERKWFEATNNEQEYVLGFQGIFAGDIFFAITQLKPDKVKNPKYLRELTQQPLQQIQANFTPPSTLIPAASFSSLHGIYQSEEYTLTLEEIGATVSYQGCTVDNQCIFIPQVSNREGNTMIWKQDNVTYIFSLAEESDRYRLKVLDVDGGIINDRILSAVSTAP